VERGYDQHQIPIDAFYLDLLHTGEGIKYFTWNEKLYPNPGGLLDHF
jgi:alpha-glucosidase (family GH31 glycosyl hydrolase)